MIPETATEEIDTRHDEWKQGFKQANTAGNTPAAETTPVVEHTPVVTATETPAATAPAAEVPAAEVPAVEPSVESKVITSLSQAIETKPSEQEIQTRQQEQAFQEKYREDFAYAGVIKANPALKFIADKLAADPTYDFTKALATVQVDHTHTPLADLYRSDLTTNNTAGLTPAEIDAKVAAKMRTLEPKEEETPEDKLDREIAMKEMRAELLAKLPKPADNSAILKEQMDTAQQRQTEREAYEQACTAQIEDIGTRMVGLQMGHGFVIDAAIATEVTRKTKLADGRFCGPDGKYDPMLEMDEVTKAALWDKYVGQLNTLLEESKKAGKVEQQQSRTNASQDSTTQVVAQTNELTDDQKKRRAEIHMAYGKDKELLAEKLKEANLL